MLTLKKFNSQAQYHVYAIDKFHMFDFRIQAGSGNGSEYYIGWYQNLKWQPFDLFHIAKTFINNKGAICQDHIKALVLNFWCELIEPGVLKLKSRYRYVFLSVWER